jgi:hypothetical protein
MIGHMVTAEHASDVPAWVVPPPSDVVAAHRIAAGWYRDRRDPAMGGVAAALAWVRGRQDVAPITARDVPADQAAVQGEALAADRLVQRTTGQALLLGGEHADAPPAAVTDVPWADGALAACAWVLGVVSAPPLRLPATRPVEAPELYRRATEGEGRYIGPGDKQELWTVSQSAETLDQILVDYARSDPPVGIIAPPRRRA